MKLNIISEWDTCATRRANFCLYSSNSCFSASADVSHPWCGAEGVNDWSGVKEETALEEEVKAEEWVGGEVVREGRPAL